MLSLNYILKAGITLLISLTLITTPLTAQEEDIEDISLENLLDVKITSASNRAEKLSEAPATVIVISKDDIAERGYTSTMEILDDLPGMENIVTNGDLYVRNYWRGFRNNMGAPFLLLVDGIVFNHLYYNNVSAYPTIALSNIERVEFVYGPASSVYGANAFMGVINIITRNDLKENGSKISATMTAGDNKRYIGDVNLFYKKDDLRFSLTARFETGNLKHDDVHNRMEWTKDKYYADRTIWGGFVDNPNIAGRFSSPIEHRSVDLRGFMGNTELGVQYYSLNSGYGFSYAADKATSHGVWIREEKSIYLRHKEQISEKLSSKTMLRYRESNVPPHSYFVENYNGKVDYSYWPVHCFSWSLFQDFEWILTDKLSLVTGIKYERKDLQKAYREVYGPSLPPDQVDSGTYPYPKIPNQSREDFNRIQTEDKGVYLQTKYLINDNHHLHLGLRIDDNSEYGTNATFRGGYVAKFGKFIAKALFGQAYQEPPPRILYGGWSGGGSDPNLDPEKSSTLEFSLTHTGKSVSHTVSFYYIKNKDTILSVTGGAQNIGERKIYGLDYHFRAILKPSFMKQLKLWAYYSWIDGKGDELHPGGILKWAEIGDLADHKFWFGATGKFTDKCQLTLRCRYIAKRETIQTNPIKSIDSYFTADINFSYKLNKSMSIALKVNNLFDTEYFHPGVRDASSGETPGYWEGGTWHGSSGWNLSKAPQPGRTVFLSLRFTI